MKRLLFVLITVCFLFTGCQNGILQINPSTDVSRYEALGGTVGAYLKAKKPEVVKDAAEWVSGALLMTDEEILSKNVLQTMYEYLLNKMPENAEIVLIGKSIVDIAGVQINMDASQLLPDKKPVYVECVRGFLKGYSEATK